MSLKTTSYRRSRSRARASIPLDTVSTSWPSIDRASASSVATSGSSSTTRIALLAVDRSGLTVAAFWGVAGAAPIGSSATNMAPPPGVVSSRSEPP
jgi:hypothetical protein